MWGKKLGKKKQKQSVILASDLASECERGKRTRGAWQQLSCGNRIEVGRNFGLAIC